MYVECTVIFCLQFETLFKKPECDGSIGKQFRKPLKHGWSVSNCLGSRRCSAIPVKPLKSIKWRKISCDCSAWDLYACITHWGRVTHIYVSKLSIIGPDNGLSPRRRQAIIWFNAGILLIGTLGTNFVEVLSEFYTFSFNKMHLKMSSGKWRSFCLGLNVENETEWIMLIQILIVFIKIRR